MAAPIDNEHVRGISIVAWPLEYGGPKPDWKPGTDPIADIRPGSSLKRTYEERQRKPDDLEARGGQRPIAIHALENLAHSDTGIVMLRRLLREQSQRVEQGLDPINTIRDPSSNKRIPTGAWNTILSPAEPTSCPTAKTSDEQSAAAPLLSGCCEHILQEAERCVGERAAPRSSSTPTSSSDENASSSSSGIYKGVDSVHQSVMYQM